jgi:hypothetical protein
VKQGTNTDGAQTLPESTHGYFSSISHKYFCCFSLFKKWTQFRHPLSLTANAFFLCFSAKGIQQRYQKRESKVLYL